MGGWGSGRQGGRATIGGCGSYRLALKDLGELLRSPANKVVWLNYGQNGEHRMTVVVEARPAHGYMRLQHPSRASDRAEHMDYTVGLTSTAAGFGGRRWWFSCPVSRRRCAVLYLPRGAHRFGSAKGYGLAYGVTRMEEHDRLWHRMEKIARRLGDRDPGPEIPPLFGETVIIRRDPGAGQSLATAVIEEIVPPGLGALHRHGPWQRSYGACNAMSAASWPSSSRKSSVRPSSRCSRLRSSLCSPRTMPSIRYVSRSWSHD